MTEFRVTVSYARSGARSGEDEVERVRELVQSRVSDATPRVALSVATLDVAVTVRSRREVDAIARAVSVVDAAVGDASVRASAQPIPPLGLKEA